MSLAPGVRLGPYEIHSAIGAGGMGEVYKARDTRLDRIVAIKVLPAHVAADPDVRQRFEREARAVAALNHPHICSLYDVGSQDGTDFLVMEYVEGETLADRLAKGALPLDQALRYGIEIADALDKAHRAGIVHRDLKPGNVMLTKAGTKLLDFGLAKTGTAVVAGTGLSMLPTIPPNLTAQGTILGTFQYMAPEQLEGQEADARTDIFAFGAVLYEMFTGRKAFDGNTQASLIAAIMEHEPAPVSRIQTLAPRALDRVVAKCLAKETEARWHTSHDLHDELEWIRQTPSASDALTGARVPSLHRELVVAVVGLLVGAASALAVWKSTSTGSESGPTTRFEIVLPTDTAFTNIGRHVLTFSPDGSRLVFVANQQLYARRMDQLEATPIRGSNVTPIGPFFSSDGQSVAFWSNNQLKKVAVGGGAPVTIAEASNPYGASWSGNSIFWGAGADGIFKVLKCLTWAGHLRGLLK
jgi:serine/threonine protein kinase